MNSSTKPLDGFYLKHRVSPRMTLPPSASQADKYKHKRQIEKQSRSLKKPHHAQASSTWTEPPSLSAVTWDPRVSLLVTGVGWDSLRLGSGDWSTAEEHFLGGERSEEWDGDGDLEVWWEEAGGWVNKQTNQKWNIKMKTFDMQKLAQLLNDKQI